MKIPLQFSWLAIFSATTAMTLAADSKPNAGKYAALTAAAREANATTQPMAAGKFQPAWESLQQYETPEWFRDAKFGIWAHWGPQCQPEMGDWYAQRIYKQLAVDKKTGVLKDNPVYNFHVARYGPPSKFGFKDVIRTWQAERWDPEKLMALYKRAGARYFMALANHHDNLDLWDSKYQPWNAVNLGPHKDLIGGWEKAARKEGLRFGVSVHASRTWSWYEVAQGSDSSGPQKGVPYDGKLTAADGSGEWWEGLDPQDLYAQSHPVAMAGGTGAPKPVGGKEETSKPDEAYIRKFYNRTVDLLEKYRPDMVYFDDTVLPFYPYNDTGLQIAADFYNSNMASHGGKLEAVINGKGLNDEQKKSLVFDIERGKSNEILPLAWQTDTCLGDWHYRRSIYEQDGYKKSGDVIRMLVDIVSKNGNLMLSVPLRGEGTLDDIEVGILSDIGAWMDVNREAIFATRPWKVFGEGPALTTEQPKGTFGGSRDITPFSAEDIRFTRSKDGQTLYAIVLGEPKGDVQITSLGKSANLLEGPIKNIQLLGHEGAAEWSQNDQAVTIKSSGGVKTPDAVVYKISL